MNIAFSLLSESGNVIDRLQSVGSAQEQLADADYWSTVGILTLTGILVVFLILAILIFFFWLMGTVFKAIDKSRAAKKAAAAEAEKAKLAVEPTPAAPVVEEDVDDEEEIVAVISAAVAAYAEAEGTAYTVKSISRHKDARVRSAWSMAGISDNMRQF
ncbi:MAG: OadG family protein [Lachnospiraceae bacterium]|nr:OadG family protein [Ruminococcus sp.]MCM1275057.1 OadG family protein [Lachnospiraceae bacterium]